MPTPLFNSVTGKQAAQKAVEARKENRKTTRWLAKLGLKEAETKKIFELLQTVIATPGGTFLSGWLLIDLLDRLGYFNRNPTNNAQGAKLNTFVQGLQQGALSGANIFNSLLNNGLLGLGTSVLSGKGLPSAGSTDADLLKTALFSICMVQALGGGQGIQSLIAPLLTAVK